MSAVEDSKKIVWVGCEGGKLHQYNSKMLLTSSNIQKFLSYFDLIPGMKYTEFCYFHHHGIPICIETLTVIKPRFGSWRKVWFWRCKGLKAIHWRYKLFWKLQNIAHTDHIWFTTPNIVNGTILSHMWKFLILFIPLSTWIRREGIDCVSTTSWGLICPLLPKKML